MAADPFDITGRAAIVTGATSGLGARFARVLAERGARVVAAGRRQERLDALAAEIDGLVPCRCDVTQEADLDRLLAVAADSCGPPQILVNNAGVEAADASAAEFRRVVETNLHAVYALSAETAKLMTSVGGGSIINVASIFGLVATAAVDQAAYSASKGAVVQLTRELGVRWARDGVRVNAVAPGFFPSEMTATKLSDERTQRWLRRNTPMGRPGAQHELDGALLLLASDASSFMTGQTIAVDGGWTAR